ncbi:MAG: DNA polymerase [Minisyncoccia bacterium]
MKKLLLIDANSLIHRSFHALPPLTGKGGVPTGALYGLAGALLRILSEHKPDYAVAAFDRPEPTFRKEMYEAYKAHRPKAPDELVSQIIEAHNLFREFGINYFEKPGFEADDIIGTFVKKFGGDKNLKIVILTGDLDSLQLIKGEKIVVETFKRGVSETLIYDERGVFDRYGLKPAQMTDYKGLVGDASDNIPGVRGIGPKTAETFISKYGSLEKLFENMPESDPAGKKVLPFKKEALFSKELATINRDVPIEVSSEEIKFPGLEKEKLSAYFEKFGFESLIRRMEGIKKPKETKEPAQFQEKLFPLPEPEITLGEKNGRFQVAWDWKPIFKKFIGENKKIPKDIFDLLIAGWLLNPDETEISPEAILNKFLGRSAGKTNNGVVLSELSLILEKKMKQEGLERVFYEIEMPLIETLAWMEVWGVGLEKNKLKNLLRKMEDKLNALTKRIYAAAGGDFNINSSRQVAEALFEKLKIKSEKIKKTGTGLRSTSEEVLLSIKDEHPVVTDILTYRETFKIKSTYVEPLLKLCGQDGRIRTNFIQTGTATGRLASEKPNLQNIPQESEWAKELREAFIVPKGCSFFSFDYAQLELRLLAHMSGDENLIAAFEKNQDIHTLTASRILKIPSTEVSRNARRLGKTLNFGVVYGMGPRAFAQSAGVSLEEGKKFISDYYREFPKVKKWQDEVKAQAAARGYVENLNGRRRWFWTDARHPKIMGEIERAAVNMPLQSLGADVIKMAMIKSFALMKEKGWFGDEIKMVLTVHDELLFEIRDDILSKAVPLIKDIMEDIYPLAAPLKVDVRYGKNLGDLREYKHKNE